MIRFLSQTASTMPPKHGIRTSFFALGRAIAEHLLALFSLASFEAEDFFKKILSSLFLFFAIVGAFLMAYLSFLATLVVVAITQFGISWLIVSSTLMVTHLLIGGTLLFLLSKRQHLSSAFQMTKAEIQRDLEALASTKE